MKLFNNKQGFRALCILVFTVCFNSSNAQIKVSYDNLNPYDSISIQTKSGMFFGGNFLSQTDSSVTMLLFENYDTLVLNKGRIYVVYMMQKETPNLANTTQPDTIVVERSLVEIDKTKIERPSNIVMLGQVAGGTLSLAVGGIGGAFVGFFAGAVIIGDPYVGAAIGGVSGGLLSSAYFIYKTGNTASVRGKYLTTLAGVTTGVIISAFFPPLLLIVPSLTGTLFYNYSRYNVNAQNNLGFIQHAPPLMANNGLASIPTIFQVKLIHLTF